MKINPLSLNMDNRPDGVLAEALLLASGTGERITDTKRGQLQKFVKQALNSSDSLMESGTITLGLEDGEINTKNISAGVLTKLQNQKVLTEFSPIINVQPGEIAIDTSTDSAVGHLINQDKTEANASITTRIFYPKALYVLDKLDRMTFLQAGPLLEFAINRASKKVADGLAQAVLVGGLKNEDGSDYDAIRPILTDDLAKKVTVENDPIKIAASMTRDVEDLNAEAPVVFMASNVYKALMAAALENIALLQIMGKDSPYTIIPTPLLDDKALYIVCDPVNNYVLGFQTAGMETLTDFVITKNSQYLEAVIYAAGSLAVQGGAIVATAPEA